MVYTLHVFTNPSTQTGSIAVKGNCLIARTLYFWGQHKWITKLFFNNTTTKVLYLQLWIWFALGAARLVVFRLVSVGDEMA